MIAILSGLVAGRAVQLGLIGVGLSVAVGSCVLRDKKIEARGASKVISASKEAGTKANANAQRKHAEARKPGAADRLLRDSCRDC